MLVAQAHRAVHQVPGDSHLNASHVFMIAAVVHGAKSWLEAVNELAIQASTQLCCTNTCSLDQLQVKCMLVYCEMKMMPST